LDAAPRAAAGLKRARVLLPLAGAGALSGCGSNRTNALHPESHQSRDIATLWWWMLVGAAIGFALVCAILFAAWLRRRRASGSEALGWRVVVAGGIAAPIVILATLFVVADLFVIRTTQAPAASRTKLTIRVVGHQYFWEVRYPGSPAVTANEIHIPVQTPVNLQVQTDDVIHSFWVPELNRKIDTIPGRTNRILLYADKAGTYRGDCAEFCGLQHAHMGILVFADPPAEYRAWLARQARPAPTPSDAQARRGHDLFMSGTCSTCHTIRGTKAQADVGPDLTHVAGRTTLGALTVPNTRADLANWIRDSQQVKPGNQMPATHISAADLDALVAYLETLK
jgi:cytochrome c oxidase subunit 2